jgi:hypothetical protein
MARRCHELAELQVRYRRPVDPEATDRNLAAWRLLGIVPVGSHAKYAAWNPDHAAGAIIE